MIRFRLQFQTKKHGCAFLFFMYCNVVNFDVDLSSFG